eukprot:scaffold5517_cov135-Cylindrotheca_fusiformis.AAC.43
MEQAPSLTDIFDFTVSTGQFFLVLATCLNRQSQAKMSITDNNGVSAVMFLTNMAIIAVYMHL